MIDTSLIIVISGIAVSIFSFIVSFRYRKFFWSFIFLGMSFAFYASVELGYYMNSSLSDSLLIPYYIFALLHPISVFYVIRGKVLDRDNVKYGLMLFGAIIIPCLVISGPEGDAINALYMGASASIIVITVMIIRKMSRTILVYPWLMIGASLLIASFTDISYFIYDNLSLEGTPEIMMQLWFVSDMAMLMGIILHLKKI